MKNEGLLRINDLESKKLRRWVRVARRIALNVNQILLGEKAGTLAVRFDAGERLVINMETGGSKIFSFINKSDNSKSLHFLAHDVVFKPFSHHL